MTAMTRAVNYAHQHGVTLIASAGNEGWDFDHASDLYHLPSDLPHVISVSATRPLGWALGPATDLDLPASYTNYGQSVIAWPRRAATADRINGWDPARRGQSRCPASCSTWS